MGAHDVTDQVQGAGHVALHEHGPPFVPAGTFHDAPLLERGIGIRFNGQERTNVEEYCISEGWVKVPAGKTLDRKGNPLLIKLKGKVEPYFERAAESGEGEGAASEGD